MSKHFGPASLTLAAAIVVASCGQSDEAQANEEAAAQPVVTETAPEPSPSLAAQDRATSSAAAAQDAAAVVVAAAQGAADETQPTDETATEEESVTEEAEAAAEDEAAADGQEAAAGDEAAAAAIPEGDAAAGKRVFARCMACHALAEGQNRVGPSLHGLFGRTAGTVEGFRYSDANKNSGVTWTEATLFEYLENPREYIPGTIMAFPGLPAEQDRANLIAYLKENT